MYNLPYYKVKNPEAVFAFVKEHPFAFLAGTDAKSRPVATQVPVFIDERDGKLFLTGHIMRNTDHHKAFLQNPNVLAVFTSPHTYVSASWYSDKNQASTWNYMSVHARGMLRFLDNAELMDVLKRTTNHFENNPHSGSNFEDLSSEYINRLAVAIIAFEIEVLEIDHVFKLSQNRDVESYNNFIKKLDEQDDAGKFIAGKMRINKDEVFNKD